MPLHILDSITDHVGQTPLVRLTAIGSQEGFQCNLLGKCEFVGNPGSSVKDRIAKRMVEMAEQQGKLIPGKSVVIEPTSGNTGIGLSLMCAAKGYRCIIVMPEKMSQEKATVIKALGAEIVRTPTEAAYDSPESHISVARRLEKEIPHGIILDQYANANNPLAHYLGTGQEIVEAIQSSGSAHGSSGHADVLFAGAGTGGTITGIARRIKEDNPKAIVVGIDPVGSLLARPESLNTLKKGESPIYKVEGIGYDFVPDVLDYQLVDEWTKSRDEPSFEMARRLIRHEGLLCGGSSGTAVEAGVRWLKETEQGRKIAQTKGANVVFVLPDSIRNYVTKDWLVAS